MLTVNALATVEAQHSQEASQISFCLYNIYTMNLFSNLLIYPDVLPYAPTRDPPIFD